MATGALDSDAAAGLLRAGGVLILTTDTLPGFHCRADHEDSVRRIARIKGRSAGKPLLVLAADRAQARQVLGDLTADQKDYCRRCWPGPFSLILPADPGVGSAVTAGSGTVAIRVPALDSLRNLLLAVGHPLVSTSVNREGHPPALELEGALAEFATDVDGYFLCPPEGPQVPSRGVSSALVDLTVWPPKTLREGPERPPEVAG